MTHTYDLRCYQYGSSCSTHGRRVRAAGPRAALARVVDPDRFGPLHRWPGKASLDRAAFVKEAEAGLAGYLDTHHGAIIVRQVGETRG